MIALGVGVIIVAGLFSITGIAAANYVGPGVTLSFVIAGVSCLFAGFIPGRIVGEMTSIGTLFAFILVCVGVLVMRKKMPDAPRAFRTPLVPLVPILGIGTCFYIMVFLPLDTWIRLVVWMLIGLDVYLFYSIKHSVLLEVQDNSSKKANKIIGICALSLVVVLIVIAQLHHHISEQKDFILYYFSLVFAVVHLIIYSHRYYKYVLAAK